MKIDQSETTLSENISIPAAPVASFALSASEIKAMMNRYGYPKHVRETIEQENLLPPGLLGRLQTLYPQHSGLLETSPFLFLGKGSYIGVSGFREIVGILRRNGIVLGDLTERELFIEVYRFKASRHILNTINWENYEEDPMYHLVFPQTGMIRRPIVEAYIAAETDEQRAKIVSDYMIETNPHDGNQLLNKPWIENEEGEIEILEGSQHKYPQCQLVFDYTTQSCFAFCTYCFRHAQVRGDHDMFIQKDIDQIHNYLRKHPEVTDILITGGDAGYLPADRFKQYILPLITDPTLAHVRTIRIGTRLLTYEPERVLNPIYEPMLELFDLLHENGIQLAFMAHISTPRELLNPSTIAAIRRLQRHGVAIRSQSPMMNHISLFMDKNRKVDIRRTAQNWIDLGNLLATLLIRFHSIYCARATGEYQYFGAPLADVAQAFNLAYRSLASLHRPSRYITMTTSAGKLSILGTAEINGEKAFALKFNESRDMEWMDQVFLAKYNQNENRIDNLVPFEGDSFFFEDSLERIEEKLREIQRKFKISKESTAPVPATEVPQ